jgi:acyl-CoA reductase-like NAD-dependent aldehyde dehydrogenase
MPTLAIHNPATGALITTVPADDAASVAAKAAAARAAQPAWAAVPIADKVAVMQRFRAALIGELETLAATMTAETGKPIALSRNELNGLLPRIDFFMEEAESAVRDEHVFDGGGMHETDRPHPAGRGAEHLGLELPLLRGLQRHRAGAADRQRGAVQAQRTRRR